MPDRDQFGVRLRRERERRRISLEELAEATNVSVDLWEGMERNDFAHWPSGIFARAFVRDYARVLGLDADEVVDEFCRHFEIADRRTLRLVEAQAELLGHPYEKAPGAEPLPAGRERRAAPRAGSAQVSPVRGRYGPRTIAAAIDTACVCSVALAVSRMTDIGFWTAAGAAAIAYQTTVTVVGGSSLGLRVVDLLRTHAPTLFSVNAPLNDARRVEARQGGSRL